MDENTWLAIKSCKDTQIGKEKENHYGNLNALVNAASENIHP